ncbi:MAG: hypothetical protein ACI4S9_03525 [Christensenellales bacterium]
MKKIFGIILSIAMVICMATSVSSICFAASDYDGYVDLISDGGLGFSGASMSGNSVVLPSSGINRVYTANKQIGMTDLRLKMTLTKSSDDWEAMIGIRKSEPRNTSWEGDSRGYHLTIYGNNFTLAGAAADLPENFWGVEHVWDISVTNTESAVVFVVKIDGSVVMNATDGSNERITEDGYVNVFNHNVPACQVVISEFSTKCDAAAYTEKSYVSASALNLSGAVVENGAISMSTAGIDRISSAKPIEDIQVMEFDLELTGADSADWLLMMFFNDNAPSKASWERGDGENAYVFMFYSNVIGLKKQTGTTTSALANGEYAVPSGFYDTPHHYRFSIGVTASKIVLTVAIDGVPVISSLDESDLITQDGHFTFAKKDSAAVTATFTSFDVVSMKEPANVYLDSFVYEGEWDGAPAGFEGECSIFFASLSESVDAAGLEYGIKVSYTDEAGQDVTLTFVSTSGVSADNKFGIALFGIPSGTYTVKSYVIIGGETFESETSVLLNK